MGPSHLAFVSNRPAPAYRGSAIVYIHHRGNTLVDVGWVGDNHMASKMSYRSDADADADVAVAVALDLNGDYPGYEDDTAARVISDISASERGVVSLELEVGLVYAHVNVTVAGSDADGWMSEVDSIPKKSYTAGDQYWVSRSTEWRHISSEVEGRLHQLLLMRRRVIHQREDLSCLYRLQIQVRPQSRDHRRRSEV